MKNVLVISASSQTAQWTDKALAKNPDINLTLFLRHPNKLSADLQQERQIVGDATDLDDVRNAVKGMDIVYASLAGEVKKAAETIVKAMDLEGGKLLIWTSSLGIYNEIPAGTSRSWAATITGTV